MTTTYIVRPNGKDSLAYVQTRTSGTMHYTHAVLAGRTVVSWHLSVEAARKAQRANWATTGKVVPVEAHEGSKATVLKRLAGGKTRTARKATPAKATPAKATTKATTAKATTKAPAKKAPVANRRAAQLQHPGLKWLAYLNDAELSQTATAIQMGVAPMTLNRLVNGHGIPTAKVTVAFARVVGKDVEQLWADVCAYELAQALADAQ